MVYLTDSALDNGLNYLTVNGDRLDICSQEPATYTEATSTYSLGNKAGATVGAPQDGDTSGRKVTIGAVTDGSITGDGDVTHWALAKTSATAELLATHTLDVSQTVTTGNVFTTNAIDVTIPDAA